MHGPQCICEICTCGRHQCPFDRAKGASSNGIFAANGSGAGGEDQFYRKKFATVADGGERAQPARPKGELSLDNMRQPQQQTQTPLTSQQKQQQSAAAAALAVDARNERFVTSAALRKRGQNSQIQLGGGGADEGKQSAMRSTYREESERALQQNGGGGGADRVRVIGRPADSSSQLFGANHPQTLKTTVHRAEFGAKKSERAQPNRPRTSDLWKREGAVEKTSHSREQFAGVQPSNRAEPFRPRENGPLVGAEGGDRTFQRETSNLSDFGPKQGERVEQQRPAGSNLFRSGEPLLERATVNRSEYGQAGRGDRFEPRVQGSSDIWKNEGRMEGRGVNREEYGREGRAERFPPTRPRESDILKGQGAFSSETQQRAEFGPKKGERAEAKRPVGSDIWKREGQTEQSSVSRSEFAERGPGDRFPARRPGTDELWRREGRMAEGGSVSRIEYQIEGKRGDRHEIQRPKAEPLFDPDIEPSGPLSTVHRTEFVHRPAPRTERGPAPSSEAMDLLRGDGSFHGETHKSAEFQPKQGDRFEARVQGSSDIWKSEGQMQGQSVSREHFGHTTGGERAEQKRPQESGILKGEGTFSSETQKRVDFGPKKGERAEAKRPVDSTLFRREGPMGLEGSVSRSDYSHTQGERTERHTRRESSGIHRPPEGTEFAKSTVSMEDFGEKHLESPEDWLAHQKRGTGNLSSFGLLDEKDGAAWAQQYAHTMNQEEFAPKELDERTLPVVHRSELSLTDPGAHFHTSTMYSDEFQQISPNSYASRSHARPSTALKLQGPREFTSDYASEFTNKIRPCPAGELVESAKKDHVDTDNFEFHAISKGHHLYKSKENLASED